MAETYSPNLGLTLIGTGDLAGTWGNTTNTNLGTLLEQAISGYQTQAITDGADTVITIPNGASGVARNMYIECTGALTANRNLIVPASNKIYFVFNNTTGGFAVTVKVSGQTGVSIPNGKKTSLACNGTDIVDAVNYISSLSLGGAFSVTNLTASGSITAGTTVTATGVITGSGFVPTSTAALSSGLGSFGGSGVALSTGGVVRFTLDGGGNEVITGSMTAAGACQALSFIPTGGAAPTLGMYGTTNLNFSTNTLLRGQITSNGTWSITAPTAGTALTVNGLAAATTFSLVASGTGTINSLTDGTRTATVATVAGGYQFKVTSNHSLAFGTNNLINWTIAATGGLSNVAPASGVALTVSGVAGTHSTKIDDSAGNNFNAGFLELPVNNQATPYTAVLADAGKSLYYTGAGAPTFTIPANASVAYIVGTTLTFENDASAAVSMTIAITSDTLVMSPGGLTGSRTLAQFGRATAHKVSATRWWISGSGLT